MRINQIKLYKYEPNDFDLYYSLVKEDRVMAYITGKGLDKEQALAKFNSIIEVNGQDNHIGYFKVFDRDRTFMGECKLERHKPDPSLLEIGYILKEEFWGKGYGTLICTKLLALADVVSLETNIIGIIDPDNAASKRLLEKFGFKSYFIGTEEGVPTEKLILRKVE